MKIVPEYKISVKIVPEYKIRSQNSRPAPAETDSNHHLAGSIEIIALQKSRFEITLSMKYFFM